MEMTSLSRSSDSKSSLAMPSPSPLAVEPSRASALTRMPKAAARDATCFPILPKPTIPKCLPVRLEPTKSRRFQVFAAMLACPGRPRRLSASMCMKASSATLAALTVPSPARTTAMPLSAAKAVSMLSRPAPARPTTRRFLAWPMYSAVTFVLEATITASASSCFASSAGPSGPVSTTRCPRSCSSATPARDAASDTTMWNPLATGAGASTAATTHHAPRRRASCIAWYR
mmetsp:Transcript_44763/g.140370  ORF Transcript_44763/g.140370 Transcript_44763/m.140370 type:complete len:230 (+) Transcript_44763:161-850(+)